MGRYAGILCGISLAFAWAAIFAPRLRGNPRLTLHVAVTSLPFVLCFGLLYFLWEGNAWILAYFLALLILAAYAVIAFTLRFPSKRVPVLSMIFLILTIWPPFRVHTIAGAMWTNSQPGIYVWPFELAGIDVLGMLFALFLSTRLWVAFARKRAPADLRVSSLCTLASAVFSGIGFYYTVPRRGGDIGEGMMYMFILVPGVILVALITFVTCVLVLAMSAARASRLQAESSGLGSERST